MQGKCAVFSILIFILIISLPSAAEMRTLFYHEFGDTDNSF
jgi:hypothetical protein